jgi:hypothetical protein
MGATNEKLHGNKRLENEMSWCAHHVTAE